MCDVCHKHGEGKKWYLQANNYSQDLKSAAFLIGNSSAGI
jgi:hypothetical protein